jgi:hypothetical protein
MRLLDELAMLEKLEILQQSENSDFIDLGSPLTSEKHKIIDAVQKILNPPSCSVMFKKTKKSLKTKKSNAKKSKAKKSKAKKSKAKKSKK